MSDTTSQVAAARACWHPVAYSRDLGVQPIAATLLGERLVLWRDSRSVPYAFVDLCIHRGTALSLGTVQQNQIVCPYHGWRYDTTGACVAIPQLSDPTRVPAKARAVSFRCLERYGLIWVALDEPRWPLPEVPELESTSWTTVPTGPFAWHSDSSRQVENFTDFGHFPFVHPGLLGDPARPVVPPYEVETDGHILRYEIVRPEAPNTDAFPIFANPEKDRPERRSRYELHLPYTIVLRLGWGGASGLVYFFASQPVAEDQCIGYCLVARNYNRDHPDQLVADFEDVIFNQDRRIVESQRPEKVPFDLAAELHLRFDAVAVAYRRAMKSFSLS
jgi:vanillate O-demethylase monooxygenase subunit